MVWLFSATIFTSAFLLFLVQPMFAKLVLPLLGGSPAVWNTCMLFFQLSLLGGYAYAHAAPAWLGVRRHAGLHLALALIPVLGWPLLVFLPIGIPAGWSAPPASDSPISWLLLLLVVGVGAPFFLISTTGPLMQRWFANTGHRLSADPYFLYVASNVGSMLALLGYPLLVEPNLPLADQRWAWSAGYALLVGLLCASAVMLWCRRGSDSGSATDAEASEGVCGAGLSQQPISPRRCLWWVLLAAVPSSQMLGVTTYLTTDVAAVPLLWVIPLTLYLLTFIIVFQSRPVIRWEWMAHLLPIVALLTVLDLSLRPSRPASSIPLHLLCFFVAALVCHGQLASDRPHARHLTKFYLLMSAGGALGGLFNALLAPMLFSQVYEYPIALVASCMLLPVLPRLIGSRPSADPAAPGEPPVGALPEGSDAAGPDEAARREASLARWDYVLPIGVFVLCGGLLTVGMLTGFLRGGTGQNRQVALIAIFCLPVVLSVFRPRRFGLCLAAVLAATLLGRSFDPVVQYVGRSFFGVHRVLLRVDPISGERYHAIVHGNTNHGMQSLNPSRREEALTYFHKDSPIGQVLSWKASMPQTRVGIAGLGAGTMAAYARQGQTWTFYEIDPLVVEIAEDPSLFTFLKDARGRGADLNLVLGDARLTLRDADAGAYNVLILDAFSSDSVPLHLISREAIALYREKLAPGGILAFNITNRYLRMEPELAALAADAGLIGLHKTYKPVDGDTPRGRFASSWVLMVSSMDDLGPLADDQDWIRLSADGRRPWSDDFSNFLRVFKWH